MATYILADNQELTRSALEGIIEQQGGAEVLRAVGKSELVQKLTAHGDAIVVLDYTLFDFEDVEQLLIVSERFELSQWVLLSDELTPPFLRKVVYSSHRFGVVFKDSPLADVREALRLAARGERFICRRATEVILASTPHEEKRSAVLTSTEVEIVLAIAQGKTTKEIATERFSSVHTIITHRKNIFRKLEVNSAREVVKYAIRAGLVDSSEFYI